MADSTIKGMASLTGKLYRLKKAVDAEIKKGLYLSALQVEENMKTSIMGGGKTGRIYMKGKKKNIPHRASAPWEAPANDTGRLVNSIRSEVDSNGKVARVRVGGGKKNVAYAAALEFGNPEKGLAPRPYARPALKKAKPDIERLMRRTLKDATDSVKKR